MKNKAWRNLTKMWVMVQILLGVGLLQACRDDSLMKEPSWLGNSIYEQLEKEGDYTYTLHLIDDLGLKEVFKQTGSKTLFVTNDETYDAFFASKKWGVEQYADLTNAQKKILLNSAMINNAYLIDLLSNVSGNPPEAGQCMRRPTAISVYDSVSRILPDAMPETNYWEKYRKKENGIVLLRDNSPQPMIHFLPAYMRMKKITDEDLRKLTNNPNVSTQDAYVNGLKIYERNITCKNGYIHKVDGVMLSADNMADIVRGHGNMSIYNKLLSRFCAPYYDAAATKEYNRLYNNSDSVYVLRYFAQTSAIGDNDADPEGQAVDAQLAFDPGWNAYIYDNTAGYDLHYDAGAMLVPTNEALDKWWNGEGKVLQDYYGSWGKVPLKVLSKLMNLNMVNSFSETVPSKFTNIVDNTTKLPLGITSKEVDSCFMGCNGVVYLTNTVFTPADYSSVSFPALINQDVMSVIYWGIEQLNFEAYLNSMDSYYSFIIPTNNAMLRYVDPCSYKNYPMTTMYEFYYDNEVKSVKARRFKYNVETKSVMTDEILSNATNSQILDRLEDMIDNMIVVGNVEDGHTYYKTKGGSVVRVANAGKEGLMTVEGGWQIEEGNAPGVVSQIYDFTEKGNGKSYVIDSEMPMSSKRSAYAILKDNPDFSEFYKLLSGSSLMIEKLSSTYTCVNKNISLFDAYNYTIYVPTNEAIQQLYKDSILPTWNDYEAMTVADFDGDASAFKTAQTALAGLITDFLRYHIQDNSIFIGGEPVNGQKYETSKMNRVNKRFYSLTIQADDDQLIIVDGCGDSCKVNTDAQNYNLMGREYWIEGSGNTDEIYNASDLVIHQIGAPLFYDAAQKGNWKEKVGLKR